MPTSLEHPFTSFTVRQSIFLLLPRVIVLEILLELLAIFPRVIIFLLFPQLLTSSLVVFSLEGFFVLLTIIQIVILINMFFVWESRYYEVRASEIDSWSGVFHKKKETLSFVHAESLAVHQSFWGRVFHYGTVTIYVPTLRKEIILENVPDPHHLAGFLKQELPEKDTTVFIRR